MWGSKTIPMQWRKLFFLCLCWLVFEPRAQAEFVAVYAQPKQPKYQAVTESFRKSSMLERIAALVNADVRTPGTIRLVAAECGTANAFYDPQRRAVVLCHELMEQVTTGVMRDFSAASSDEMADTAAGAIFFLLYHEIGHALIHVLNLPVIAREEDMADAISSFFMLRSPIRVQSMIGASWFFRQKNTLYTNSRFGNEHSLDEQRQFNVVCYALGSDAQTFAPLVVRVGLPSERARRCPAEYARLETSVRKLLGSSLRR